MQRRLRAVSALAILALTASLAVVPGLLQTATATTSPAQPARSGVTAECAAAQVGLADARSARAKARKALRKAKKALRAAKHTHRPAKVKKAKRVLRKARHRYAVRTQRVNTANKRMAYACSAPTSATRANATGQETNLLVLATGTVTELLDTTQLTAILDRLLPGVSAALSPAQLTALLAGFNTGPLGLDDATALLGGSFATDELQSILGGTASPALVLQLADHIIGQLSGLTGGVLPVPGSFDPTDLLETIAGVFGTLDPAQLGGLVALLLTAVGEGGTTLDAAQLADLLDALIPGLSALLDPAELTTMLGAVNAGSLDPSTLANLLGGRFTAVELGQVTGGTAGPDLVGEVLGDVIAQLGTIGGGGLTLPGTLEPAVLQDLVTTVTGLVTDLLGGLLGSGGAVCTLLPILC